VTGGKARTGLLLALGAAVVSGVAVYVNGEAVGRFSSPTVYTSGKNLVAGVLLVSLSIASGRRRNPSSVSAEVRSWSARERVGLIAVAVIGGAVPFVLFFEGLARATSSDAAFLHKTLVVWVAVLAVSLLGERLTPLHVGAVALLIVGQIAVADGVGSLRPGVGEAMILAATICWAVELILVKQLVETLPSTTVGASRIGCGAVLLVIWLALTGRLVDLVSLSMVQWAWLALTGSILSVFVTVWFAAVARAPVTDVAAVLVPGAVITGLIRLAVGGNVAPIQVVGWVLMIAAIGALVARPLAAGGGRRAIGVAA
jgi:drug/metabolite transporter (DMT)-like permease